MKEVFHLTAAELALAAAEYVRRVKGLSQLRAEYGDTYSVDLACDIDDRSKEKIFSATVSFTEGAV